MQGVVCSVPFEGDKLKGEIHIATAEGVAEFQAREIEVAVEALLAVDCDHRREQHDPAGDNRCDGCGRGSDWHKSAMFLCTSSKCAVSVCEDCHGVLNARQARSEASLQCEVYCGGGSRVSRTS